MTYNRFLAHAQTWSFSLPTFFFFCACVPITKDTFSLIYGEITLGKTLLIMLKPFGRALRVVLQTDLLQR